MNKQSVIQRAKAHLQVLCSEIGERRVGSEANRQSTAYAEKVLKQLGWPAESTRLSVIDWHTDGAMLTSILLHYWSREGRKPWCVPPGAMQLLRGVFILFLCLKMAISIFHRYMPLSRRIGGVQWRRLLRSPGAGEVYGAKRRLFQRYSVEYQYRRCRLPRRPLLLFTLWFDRRNAGRSAGNNCSNTRNCRRSSLVPGRPQRVPSAGLCGHRRQFTLVY